MKYIINILLLLTINITYGQYSYSSKLKSVQDFQRMEGSPLASKYGNVTAVKVVYDIKKQKLYYINSTSYKYHFEFCTAMFSSIDLINFNKYNYSENHKYKRFLLGNINHYPFEDLYTLEIAPSDKMLTKDITKLYNLVKNSSYFKNFKFFLNTTRLNNEKAELKIPTISSNAIFGNQIYQPISMQKSYGKLVYAPELKKYKPSKNDIIIINTEVLELPLVRGVITTHLQTPLSHIAILGKNRKIPIAAYTKAFNSQVLKMLSGKYVSLEILKDTFYIKEISFEKFKRRTKEKIKKKKVLKKDISTNRLQSMEKLSFKSTKLVGGKAANFAELQHLVKTADFKVPESAFAIPFYYYEEHIRKAKIDIAINHLLASYGRGEVNNLAERLKSIRKKIQKTPIDKKLLNDIVEEIKRQGNYRRMRFRSSTNAEDIIGFSGAGLYTSKTGIVGDSIKTISKAVKKVWASLWRKNAFLEREYFNIDQHSIAMGVLVHRSFPNEHANGVVITKNIYRKDFEGITINVQQGEESVVNPKEGVVCDQLISYAALEEGDLYGGKKAIEIISFSNLNKGKLVLSESEIIKLSKQAMLIKKYFYAKYRTHQLFLDFAMDLEFKIDKKSRELYIKQARYFNN